MPFICSNIKYPFKHLEFVNYTFKIKEIINMKKIRVLIFSLFLAILLTGCIKIPVGDGETLEISKDGLTFSDKEGKESSIDFDKEGETLSVSTGDGEEWTTSLGGDVDLPEDFPVNELPLTSDAIILTHHSSSADGTDAGTLIYYSKEEFETVANMYQNHFEATGFDDVKKETYGEDGSDILI